MFPQPQFELASMLTALYCVTMIHQLFEVEHGQTHLYNCLETEKS